MLGEKASCEVYKNASSYFEQILEAAPYKKQLYGHLPPSSKIFQKVRKTWFVLLEKQEQIHKWFTYGHISVGRPGKITFLSSVGEIDAVLGTY